MRTLIVSDLHLGDGGRYDCFAGGDALPALLDSYATSPTRVVVNGDGIDFLMNDDPLELDPRLAVEQARAIAKSDATARVFAAFGRVIEAGGEVIVRLGNHDVELALPEVQAVFRGALGLANGLAERLQFQIGDKPALLDVGGARILVTHGEHNDPWNKVDYSQLTKNARRYVYSPGSRLVKMFLNPITKAHGLRFVNMLKPDFQGGVLTLLAVAPEAMKLLLQSASVSILWQLFKKGGMPTTFSEDDEEIDLGISDRIEEAGLTSEEQQEFEEMLMSEAPASFAAEEGYTSAQLKLARAGLKVYAGLHRRVSGSKGDAYFDLDPEEGEWNDARRLAKKFAAGAVVIGHTHAARWKQNDGVTFANTGTWIWLMQLPASHESDHVWTEFLEELHVNRNLAPERQKVAKTVGRFTAVSAEPHPEGGAEMALVEWDAASGLRSLGSARIPAVR